MNKFQKKFYGTFFSLFIVVGLAVTIFGLVRLAKYYYADEVEATVISAEYDGGYDVVFGFEHGGKYIEKSVHYDKVTQEGHLPFYNGKQIVIRVDGFDNIVDFGESEIIFTLSGVIFAVAGSLFLYFFVLRKHNAFDMASEYESAMIKPEDAEDDTARYEAVADQLTKLSEKSVKRMTGEAGIWFNRIKDRLKTYTLWENILFHSLLFVPIIVLSVYPLFLGKKITVGSILGTALI